jgi:hypothetical protein
MQYSLASAVAAAEAALDSGTKIREFILSMGAPAASSSRCNPQPIESQTHGADDLGEAPPDFLMAAILGGAHELLPEALMKSMSGGCRMVQYSSFERTPLNWKNQPLHPEASEIFQSHSVAALERTLPGLHTTGQFHVHRIRFHGDLAQALKTELCALALTEEKKASGIEISNVGGWHSTQRLFRCVTRCKPSSRLSRTSRTRNACRTHTHARARAVSTAPLNVPLGDAGLR